MKSDYYKSLPMKRMGAGVIFLNSDKQILIVKPSYKDGWEIPGGVVENNESPRKAAEREVKEELGLTKALTKLLVVDYQDAQDPKTESLMFIFDGQILTSEEIKSIRLDMKEIIEFKFADLNEASTLLIPILARRVQQAMVVYSEKGAAYLENRELLS